MWNDDPLSASVAPLVVVAAPLDVADAGDVAPYAPSRSIAVGPSECQSRASPP